MPGTSSAEEQFSEETTKQETSPPRHRLGTECVKRQLDGGVCAELCMVVVPCQPRLWLCDITYNRPV